MKRFALLFVTMSLVFATGCLEQQDREDRNYPAWYLEGMNQNHQYYNDDNIYDDSDWDDQDEMAQNNWEQDDVIPSQGGAGSSQNGGASSQNGGASSQNGGASSQNGSASSQGGAGSSQGGAGSSQGGAGSSQGGAGSSQNGLNSSQNASSASQNNNASALIVATCETDPDVGYCEDNKAYHCDGTLIEDCGKQQKMCGVNANYQYGCLNQCDSKYHYCQGREICAHVAATERYLECYDPCGSTTYLGQCDGDILSYCRLSDDSNPKSVLWVEDCRKRGGTCGSDGNGGYNCIYD